MFRCGAVGKEPGSIDLGGHIGYHPLNSLQAGDWLSELDTLLRVRCRRVEGCLGYPQCLRGDADPPAVERLHGYLEAVAFPAQERIPGNVAVIEVKGRRAGTANPQLVLCLSDGETGGVFLDDEGAHPPRPLARISLREDDVHIGVRGVGDEDLRSVENVLVSAQHRRAGAGSGVGSRGRLGQGKSAQAAAGGHVIQILVFLGLGSELEDRPGGECGVRRHNDPRGGARSRHFLKSYDVAHVVRPGTTHLLGVGHAHEAQARHLRQDLLRKTVVTVDLSRDGRELGIGELPYRAADQLLLVSQLEVHVTHLSNVGHPGPGQISGSGGQIVGKSGRN